MVLKDVAQAISRNESTISRAISNKFIDTPHGVFPMKHFFSQAIADESCGKISNRSVKEEIITMIDSEDGSKPLSDQDIYRHLAEKDMNVSRRTVAKYRQAMNIFPAHLRKV